MDRLKEIDYDKWADLTVLLWKREMNILDVKDSGELAQSFASRVVKSSGGDTSSIVFTFRKYGLFVDYGVGRGSRVKKRWFNRVIWKRIKFLKHMIGVYYGEKAKAEVIGSISGG